MAKKITTLYVDDTSLRLLVSHGKKIKKLSADIGIKDVFIIGNKIRDDKDKAFIQSSFGRDAILGMIPMSERILDMDKKAGGELEDKQVLNEIEQIKNKIFTEEKEHAGK